MDSREIKTRFSIFILAVTLLAAMIFYLKLAMKKTPIMPQCSDCNVVVISLSSFSAGHSNLYGYPRPTDTLTKKWLQNGVVFDNHFAVSAWPIQSSMSLMTGLQPKHHKVYQSKFHSTDRTENVLSPEIKTLPEQFRENGFSTLFFGGAPHEAILSLTAGFERGFDYIYPKGLHTHSDLPVLFRELDKVSSRKFFAFVSSVRLHFPYFITPDFPGKAPADPNYHGHFPRTEEDYEKQYADYRKKILESKDPNAEFKARPSYFLTSLLSVENPIDREFFLNTYDQALQYTDIFVDQIFQYLNDKDLLSKTIVVITSDAGQNLMDIYRNPDHSLRTHPLFSYEYLDGVSRIPLLVYHPERQRDQKGLLHVETLSNSTDIFNLLSSLVEMKTKVPNDGIDLLHADKNARQISLGDSLHFYTGHEYYARDLSTILVKDARSLKVIDTREKIIRDYDEEHLPTHYLPLLEKINQK